MTVSVINATDKAPTRKTPEGKRMNCVAWERREEDFDMGQEPAMEKWDTCKDILHQSSVPLVVQEILDGDSRAEE